MKFSSIVNYVGLLKRLLSFCEHLWSVCVALMCFSTESSRVQGSKITVVPELFVTFTLNSLSFVLGFVSKNHRTESIIIIMTLPKNVKCQHLNSIIGSLQQNMSCSHVSSVAVAVIELSGDENERQMFIHITLVLFVLQFGFSYLKNIADKEKLLSRRHYKK